MAADTSDSDFSSILECDSNSSISEDDSDLSNADTLVDSNLEVFESAQVSKLTILKNLDVSVVQSVGDFKDDDSLPQHILEEADSISFDLLPLTSRKKYTQVYNQFKLWRKERIKTNSFSEPVFLVYFKDLSQYYSPGTLWPIYSMLRATVLTYDSIDIKSYAKLLAFIKRKNVGYVKKKSENFTNPA